jgi:hypothetical protein
MMMSKRWSLLWYSRLVEGYAHGGFGHASSAPVHVAASSTDEHH